MARAQSRRFVLALASLFALGQGNLPAQDRTPVSLPPSTPLRSATPAEMIRFSRNVPGDSKPIVVNADEIATWIEGGRRVLLLRGHVLVEQGVAQIRCQQCAIWVDLEGYKRTRIRHADVYAEGDVYVEQGAEQQRGPQGVLDLNTRGEFRLNTQPGRVVQVPQPEDPLYQRGAALVFKSAPTVSAPGGPMPIQRTSVPGPPPTPQFPGAFPTKPMPAPPPSPPPAAPPPGQPPPRPQAAAPPPFEANDIVLVSAPGRSSAGGGVASNPEPGGPETPLVQVPGPPGAAAAPTPGPPAPGPPGGATVVAPGPGPTFSIQPRSAFPIQSEVVTLPGGDQALVVTGGVILLIRNVRGLGALDIEADRVVVWTRGRFQDLLSNAHKKEGQPGHELEVYLSGNVELRQQLAEALIAPGPFQIGPALPAAGGLMVTPNSPAGSALPPGVATQPGNPAARRARRGPIQRTLRADELYYDVGRNVAVATTASLEVRVPFYPDPLYLRADEIVQLSPTVFEASKAEVSASKVPADPGLKVFCRQARMEEKKVLRRGLFGRPILDQETGKPEVEVQDIVTGRSVFFEAEDVPFFYLPYLRANARDPLGPVSGINFGYNRIYGLQLGTTLDMHEVLGIDPNPGTRWRLNLDYMGERGMGFGSDYTFRHDTFLGMPARNNGKFMFWGLKDTGEDILGGGRGQFDDHPTYRGRVYWYDSVQDLPHGFGLETKVGLLSDKNFLEQYYKQEFDLAPNQETFIYLKQQHDQWAWTVLAQPHVRNWVTETEWLPKVDGYLLGQSFFDIFTYNAHASAGYAQLIPTKELPPPVTVTDQRVNTARFDLWQEVSLPFTLGPFRLVPYGVLDLTAYTEDLNGNSQGRLYGAGGMRASLPFSRLYPGAQSDLFNVNGINHKISFGANYYVAGSSVAFNQLPQLDRLDDDATDQAIRDITPLQGQLNPSDGQFLANSPLFDLQRYAIRRLVDTRADTLDDIQVLQMEVKQRWQTKRGYPEYQHIIDWMALDLSASAFPAPERDNFGSTFAFLQYGWLWNIGDRNSIVSTGWIDPIENGPRVFTIGNYFDRTDRTSFYIGYRVIQPVHSQAVTGAVSYVFSPKYQISASSTYDFGTTQALANSLVLTRIGKDAQVSIGITYNAMQNNFGVMFEILPNAIESRRGRSSVQALGGGGGLLGR